MDPRSPDRPLRGTTTGRPIMLLLDLLGRRWTLRILWEIRGGADSFATISERCERISPTVLTRRLGELVDGDLLVKQGRRYLPTPAAEELGEFLVPMDEWAKRWVAARDQQAEPAQDKTA